jgi:ABC-type transport system involved in cytochrome bd biosynthesis fused ATPase/permease subunit
VHETFKKVLFISPAKRADFSSGRVFNLVTSDAETLQLLCQNIMGLMSSPLRIIVAMLMLYFELGFSSLVALCVLLLLMPTQVGPVQLPCTSMCAAGCAVLVGSSPSAYLALASSI